MWRWLIWAAICLAGCSGGEETGSASTSSLPPPSRVVGKFFLGLDVVNATVTARAPDGKVLAETVTDASGNFFLPGTFPASFQVIGRLGSAEFPCDAHPDQFVVINVPHALACLGGGQDFARRQLLIPEPTGLGWLEDGPRAAFSHLAFWTEAARQGGWRSYSRALVGGQQPRSYRLTDSGLSAPLQGLEPELAALARQLQTQPRLVATLNAQRSDFALKASLRSELAAKDGLGSFILGGVGGAVVSDITNNILGWITASIGWNVGTSGSLRQIQDDLNTLQADLNTLAIQGATANAVQSLATAITSTNTLISQQNAAVSVANPTNQPSAAFGNLNALLSTLGSYNAINNLQLFSNAMLGTNGQTNLILTNVKSILTTNYGIQPTSSQNFPVRSSGLLDATLQTFNYYAGQQSLTANFLVEQAHPPLPASAPAVGLVNAANTLAGSAFDIARQRQQLPPYPASDSVLVDLQNGTMWYLAVQSSKNYDDAKNYCENFSLAANGGTYSNWRLPTYYEYASLQQRGRYVAVNLRDTSLPQDASGSSYGNTGNTVQGLAGLGFTNLSAINSDGDVWYDKWEYVQENATTPGDWKEYSGHEYRLNHETDTSASKDDSDLIPFFIVRSLGPGVLPGGMATVGGGGPTLDNNIPPMTSMDLEAFEFVGEGDPSGLAGLSLTSSNVSVTLTGLAGNNTVSSSEDFLTADVNYSMAVGGSFSYGDSSQSSARLTGNTLSATVRLGGSQGAFTDLTTAVAFNTTSANATASNYAGLQGLISWHAAAAGALTTGVQVTLLDGSATASSYNGTVTQSNPPVRALRSILISPRNLLLSNGSLTSNQGVSYYCTGYYSDNTVGDLTGQVTWSLVNTATGQASPGAFFSGSQLALNGQPLPPTAAQAAYTVKATFQGLTDSTNVQLGQPPN